MAAILLRELGILFVGVVAGAAASLSVFYRFFDLITVLPLALCGNFFFSRWPMRGERLWRRRLLLVLAAFCFVVFEASVLAILSLGPRGLRSDWYFLVLGALGYIVFSLLDPTRRSKLGGVPVFRYGLRLILFAAFLVAVLFAYLREAEWMGENRQVSWWAIPADPSGAGPAESSYSVILIEGTRHPFRSLGNGESAVLTLLTSIEESEAGSPPAQHPWFERNEGYRAELAKKLFVSHVASENRLQSEVNWNPTWGEPFVVVEEFATDDSVQAWTEDEFLKWIAARNERAK